MSTITHRQYRAVAAEQPASGAELRAQMAGAIKRQRSSPDDVRAAEASIRAATRGRIYSSADLRALMRLAILRGRVA